MRWVGPDHLLLKYTSMANTEFYVVKILYFWSMMPKKWCRKRRRTNVYAVILDIDPYVFCQSVPELCHKFVTKFVTTTQPSDHNFKNRRFLVALIKLFDSDKPINDEHKKTRTAFSSFCWLRLKMKCPCLNSFHSIK